MWKRVIKILYDTWALARFTYVPETSNLLSKKNKCKFNVHAKGFSPFNFALTLLYTSEPAPALPGYNNKYNLQVGIIHSNVSAEII